MMSRGARSWCMNHGFGLLELVTIGLTVLRPGVGYLAADQCLTLHCGIEEMDARMSENLHTAALPTQSVRKQPAVVALAALGIVYGDIGTSTLYGLKQAV